MRPVFQRRLNPAGHGRNASTERLLAVARRRFAGRGFRRVSLDDLPLRLQGFQTSFKT
jgi:hypothetical protein